METVITTETFTPESELCPHMTCPWEDCTCEPCGNCEWIHTGRCMTSSEEDAVTRARQALNARLFDYFFG